ncbi:MAG TPA: ATPase, T2SS/T4P/T4SS family, partial [Gemmatimonadaceae bacterium]|nr:ATPase, T2SS/T4P/T4SS family [Gemmatimonadaceae bacterium]
MLNEGDLGTLEMSSGPRPVTKSALTAPQVLGLLKEIAPPESARSLDEGRPATFRYASADGDFGVQALVDAGRWRVRIAIDPNAEPRRATPVSNGMPTPARAGLAPTPARGNGAQSGAAMASAARPTPSAPSARPTPAASITAPATPTAAAPSAVPAKPAATNTAGMSGIQLDAIPAFEGIEEARTKIDTLLRQLVERGASDLHLRCGEPPILRHHGEMVRLEGFPVLDDATLSTMLRAIMPERNRLEFAESNDTDYAHEIPGCARFRANALKDRNGVAAVFRQIPAQVVTVEQMGISPEVQRLCYLTKGLVLVTGPTGSGKSTTLCALI